MAYIQNLDPNATDIWAALDAADRDMPGWDVSEGYGDRYLSERDFPIYDESADLSRVSNEDWELFFGSRF